LFVNGFVKRSFFWNLNKTKTYAAVTLAVVFGVFLLKRNGDILGLNLIRLRRPDAAVKSVGLAAVAIFLSACVSGAPTGPTSLASVLTPEQAETVEKVPAPSKELQLSPAPTATAKPKTPAPAVKTALVKTETTTTPALKAAEAAATAQLTRSEAQKKVEAEQAKKKTGLFAAFAKSNQAASSRKRPSVDVPKVDAPKVAAAKPKTKKPRVKTVVRNGSSKLPGVRGKSIFGIDENKRNEDLDEPVKVAAVTNLARRGTHGLLLQRKSVKVGCFPRKLVSLLKRVERKFGRTPIVTSGYRSRRYNRLIRGAKNSMHITCKAADIQVKGVSKWTLARYLRTLPGRGGVGTYCHTASVHIDIGTKRDWNRRCSRKRKRRRT
jgi:uncharacterized protein YcbK (DUF882 family)